jgi:hypothetical protein
MLNVADDAIGITLGAAGNTAGIDDALLVTALNGAFPTGATTDVIKFATSSAGANSTYIANYAVDAWKAAAAY